jgi:hypothetical protein
MNIARRIVASIVAMWGGKSAAPPPVQAAIGPDSSFGVLKRGDELLITLDAESLDRLEQALQARRAALWAAEGIDRRKRRAPVKTHPTTQETP